MRSSSVKRVEEVAANAGTHVAMVIAWEGDVVRLRAPGTRGVFEATLAVAGPYAPVVGDRVVVSAGVDGAFVVGVLGARERPIPLEGGGSVRVEGGRVDITDAEGRVVVRYEAGSAEIVAPAGDLTLAASGNVVVRSGGEIALEADRASLRTASARVETGEASLLARRVTTTAATLVQRVERYELTATRIVEKTRDVYRDATDLAQTRVGRARTLVKDVYAVLSRRTVMTSEEDTSIDGSKILLG